MITPDSHSNTRFDQEVHLESHYRMSGDERPYSELTPLKKLSRAAMISSIQLPDVVQEIKAELTVFQSELDFHGLAVN